MSYPLIINTLREFHLITDDEFRAAYRSYVEGEEQGQARREAHREAFYAQWEAQPWWKKKLSLGKEYGWGREWAKQPFEVRYPEWAKEQELIQAIAEGGSA